MSINKVILVGNLGSNPEEITNSKNIPIARFRLATSSKTKEGEETEWHTIKAFGKLAKQCIEHLSKGRQVYVEGKLHYNKWTDKQGIEKITTEILADEVAFLDSKGKSTSSEKTKTSKKEEFSKEKTYVGTDYCSYNDNLESALEFDENY